MVNIVPAKHQHASIVIFNAIFVSMLMLALAQLSCHSAEGAAVDSSCLINDMSINNFLSINQLSD